jgi:hypothetical protein
MENMEINPKSIEEYSELLGGLKRIHLKLITKIIDLIHDKIDLDSSVNYITIDEDEAEGRGFSVEDLRNIYIRLSSKKFEVFPVPDKANPVYKVFNLPNPVTGKSKLDTKGTNCIGIGRFPIDDSRSNNFNNFDVAIDNRIRSLKISEKIKSGNTNEQKEPIFDPLNRIIYFGQISHSFHGSDEKQRLSLFKLLWDKRKVIKGTKLKREGTSTPPETVAANLKIVSDAQSYKKKQNNVIKERFRNFLKSINSDFRKKGLPIRISQRGGILINVLLKG